MKKQAQNILKPTNSSQVKNLRSEVEQMSAQSRGRYTLLISICLALAIIAVYWPVYSFDFIRFDDGDYVVRNSNIQSGFSWETINWAFTTNRACNWHPITWLSHTFDYQLFKNWAGGYHLANVGFHIANAILLCYVLLRMTKTIWPSALVGALFALHPLHIESVAWIAERKDLLSTLFWLLTMLAYVRYVEKQNAQRYLIAILLFATGLMAKPMLVTLPFVLLLIDYWPLERKFGKKIILEKIPFLALSLICSIITYVVQRTGGSVSAFQEFGAVVRIKNAIVSYIAYIWKMIYPADLAILYPHPGDKISMIKVVICALLLVSITAFVIYIGRRRKYFITGWFWYVGTLVPVIGIIQVGAQAMADRYTYITLTGLFIIIAWSTKEFVPPKNYKTAVLIASLLLIILSINAGKQVKYWKNSPELFVHAIEVTQNNYMMLDNVGSILVEQGKIDDAIRCFQESLKIYPGSPPGNNNLGCALQETGDFKNAEHYFYQAIKSDPNFIHAYLNLGRNLQKQNKSVDANEVLTKALKIDSGNISAFMKLGSIFAENQMFEQAILAYDKVIRIDPLNIEAHGNRSLVFGAVGKIDEAINDICFVLRANPYDVMMYRNLGIFLERKGDIAGAVEAYRAGLRIQPDNENLRQILDEDLKILSSPK